MVGISFKKKLLNIVHLETYTSYKEYQETHKLKMPLESFITYCVHKYCTSPFVAIRFIPVKTSPENEMTAVTLVEENLTFLINEYEIPWPVALCVYPVIMCEDTIITGLCAVNRHICLFKNCHAIKQEHEDGLLGFRQSCLQAPNEVSIWTKFCEVDIIKTVHELLTTVDIKEVPKNLVRFEDHMKKPVRVHNVYKVARNIKKESLKAEIQAKAEKQVNTEQQINSKLLTDTVQQTNAQQEPNVVQQTIAEQAEQQANAEPLTIIADQQDPAENREGSSSATRAPKSRKWKSHKKKDVLIDSSTKVEDLDVSHQYAEGPFLTLADLVLLPSYHVIIQSIGETRFESLLPFTYKWYKNIVSLPKIQENYISLMNQFNLTLLPLPLLSVIMPITEDVSLYKSDPKRHNPKKRLFTKEDDIEKALSSITEGMELTVSSNDFEPPFKWDEIPEHANPFTGYLPDARVLRKSQQLENLALAVLNMATDGDLIVDFCCGSGHLGILLAHLLPRCTIILLENKVQSLCRAKERVKKMRLTNVFFYQCNVDFFIGEFDIGIGLHACGIATDLILDKCLKVNAKFVLSPCCYGSLHATNRMVYPRSNKFSSVPIDQYLCIGHAADQTHKEHPLAVRGARCMTVIDSDRGHLAEELGYKVTLTHLKPITCTPKNNLLIGMPIQT